MLKLILLNKKILNNMSNTISSLPTVPMPVTDPLGPVVLVLQSADRSVGGACDMFITSLKGKTHRLATVALENAAGINPAIRATYERMGPIDVLVLMAHGKADCMLFQSPGSKILSKTHFWDASKIHSQDLDYLQRNAKILLVSCEVGQQLAQQIANIAEPRTVLASHQKLYYPLMGLTDTLDFWCFPAQSHYLHTSQGVYRFQKGQSPEPALPWNIRSPEAVAAIAENIRSVHSQACQGNPEKQGIMGFYTLVGMGGIQPSLSESMNWLQLAAGQRDPDAHFLLGCLYEYGLYGCPQSFEQAFHWYQSATALGHPDSLPSAIKVQAAMNAITRIAQELCLLAAS